MKVSERLKQWRDTFSSDELNAQANQLEKMVMRAFEIYVKNKNFTDHDENRDTLTRLAKNLIPCAWAWSIESYQGKLFIILGRFFGAIKDDNGNIM